jgi:Tol biopolymer transport system component
MFTKLFASVVAVLALSAGVAYAATQSAAPDGHRRISARTVSVPAQIAYPGNGKIYLIKANGTDQRVLISGGPEFRVDHWGGIAWAGDARQIAFTVGNHRAGEHFGDTLRLYVAAGDGTNLRPLKGTPLGSFDPSWSPDGSQIAFAIRREDETSITVIGSDGKGLRKLVTSADPRDFYWTPDWSPDGAWILFEMSGFRRDRPSRLMAIRPDGTGLRQVAAFDTGTHCICGDWSPDGKRIAYQATGTLASSDYPEIWVMNADGSGRVQLSRNRVRDENPDWSPDGKRIAFYSERPGTSNAEIYVIPAQGTPQARRVTHDTWYNGAPRWRPIG